MATKNLTADFLASIDSVPCSGLRGIFGHLSRKLTKKTGAEVQVEGGCIEGSLLGSASDCCGSGPSIEEGLN